jgi:hypothetical protein
MKKIIEGYSNWLKNILGISEEDVESIAKKRLEECYTCIHRKNDRCDLCGCNLKAKSRSTSSKCPIEKW